MRLRDADGCGPPDGKKGEARRDGGWRGKQRLYLHIVAV